MKYKTDVEIPDEVWAKYLLKYKDIYPMCSDEVAINYIKLPSKAEIKLHSWIKGTVNVYLETNDSVVLNKIRKTNKSITLLDWSGDTELYIIIKESDIPNLKGVW